MSFIYRFLGSPLFLIINASVVLYICQRVGIFIFIFLKQISAFASGWRGHYNPFGNFLQQLWRAMRYHRQLMLQMKDFESTVKKARLSLDYVGEEVSKGMQGIKDDIKQELFMTDRMTNLSSQVTGIVQRFTALEENILEFIRKNQNAESVRLETPDDVKEEVRKVLRRVNESQLTDDWRDEDEQNKTTHRNPLSKFSTVTPAIQPSKEIQDRPKSPLVHEVQLLQGTKPVISSHYDKKNE